MSAERFENIFKFKIYMAAYYRVYYVSKDLHLDGRGKAVEKVLN